MRGERDSGRGVMRISGNVRVHLLLFQSERPYKVRNMPDDVELLREYVEHGSEEAFRRFVERHTGMVHGAALRIVRNESMAEEVTQAVFIILARKARSLRRKTVLVFLHDGQMHSDSWNAQWQFFAKRHRV